MLDGGAKFYGPKSDQSDDIYAEIEHKGAIEYTQCCWGVIPRLCVSERLSPIYHSEITMPTKEGKEYTSAVWQGLLAYLVLEEHTNFTMPQYGIPDKKADKLKN